ncbi:hypothetical protein J4573_49870 [Actinomadura barringtoniae]|uniref:Uncharacterized protein n=1 Tax=Actinomadura barringtoniae TaxID=1427535 RepID=A0A939PS56_9ACTN|nr:hypothetical protein [Actinomadura barringtoniae]MBO2455268.1 hypothetical protein [Actinomadura barringtoniae]
MRGALAALGTDENLTEEGLPLAAISMFAADDVWDDEGGRRAWERLEAYDRAHGALGALRSTLMVGATWELRAGRFDAAEALHDEMAELSDVVGQPHPGGVQRIEFLAWSGREAEARAMAAQVTGADDLTMNSLTVLEISLGHYGEALAWALPSFERDSPGLAARSLHEIVEAGVRGGDDNAAKAALARLEGARHGGRHPLGPWPARPLQGADVRRRAGRGVLPRIGGPARHHLAPQARVRPR